MGCDRPQESAAWAPISEPRPINEPPGQPGLAQAFCIGTQTEDLCIKPHDSLNCYFEPIISHYISNKQEQ